METQAGKIIYTGGTFDLFHAGHVNFLKRCSKLGDVIVALNDDDFIEAYKGKKPVMSYGERRDVLQGCKYVSDVIRNIGGSDSKKTINTVEPDVIAIGTDWMGKDYYKQMNFTQEWLDSKDIVLVYIPYTQNISTTDIKKRFHEAGNSNSNNTFPE